MDYNQVVQALNLENKFLQALIILVTFYIISELVVYVCQGFIKTFASKTKTDIDDKLIEKNHRKLSFLLILLGIKIALIPLNLYPAISDIMQKIVSSAVIVALTMIAISVTNIVLGHWGHSFAKKTSSQVDDQIILLTKRFSKTLYWLLAALFILQAWDIQIGPLLASLGIAGLAIAFALQSSLGNIFGGISLILDKSIKVGDRIELETGETGIVHDVGLRSTKIRNWSNQIIVMPNGKLADSKILNYIRKDKKARVVVPFGVAYGTDLAKVKKVVIPEIKKIKECLKDPAPDVIFKQMSDFSLNFDARFWVKSEEELFHAKEDANIRIYNALNKAKISIPFPTRTVHLKK